MLDVRRLRLLCDLSRLGTIAAVAQAHTYTPSAVSQQLSALEREAGVPLLERSGRRVTFTPAGRVLVTHAETVLAALEQTTAALAAVATGLTGPLRIGAFPTAVRTLLPATLVALGRQHPGLELTVTELDPVEVPAALRERRLDVGLLHDYDVVPVDPDPALDTVPLLDETVFLAVPAGSPLAVPAGGPTGRDAGSPRSEDRDPLRAAHDAAWIMASPGTLCHTVTLQLCRSVGFTPRVRHQADDFATVLALVAADQGVSLVPRLAAVDPPAGVRLVALGSRRRTRVAYRRGAAPHPAVAAFVAAVRAATDEFLARRPADRVE
ncbi:LysR family transcriptional regulator [Micromonospora krabiensis]|uniref:DNA-binding transcriptional regulator, LysR family n=1 Tax=Micromonospora krabiensis TaxID=307121 RepID=A0A1C3MZ31_9ACTN|nr:LysR family transcriptional regulator [Micromonospora krabiensis]SBV25606.1 DNA-binding transcriptional regulator, LysR family [Micromonospora krabiensis]